MPSTTRAAGGLQRGIEKVAKVAFFVLMVLVGSKGWCLTHSQPAAPDLRTCSFSNLVYDSDASLMRQKPPTRFRLMTSRYVAIVQAARGYHCTGMTTVAFNGHYYLQAGMSDDPGIAQLIPTVSVLTGLSLADAFDLTAFAVISLGLLIGYGGFWRSHPDNHLRWIGAGVFLCIGIAEARVGDVYIFQISPLIAGIPWVLHFALTCEWIPLNLSAGLLAFVCSWCSLVRIGTSLICLVFLTTLYIGLFRLREAFLPWLAITLVCLPCALIERNLIARRDVVLSSLGGPSIAVNTHPVWHAIYTGLGFIPNSEVPAFNDTFAMDKVRSIDPTAPYTSAKYEAILRREVLSIARHRPMLLIENIFAKVTIVVLCASILLFPARRLLFAEREILWLDSAFVLAIGLSSMNAILVVPKVPYLLTFLCLTFLYSSVKLCRSRLLSTESTSYRLRLKTNIHPETSGNGR